MSDSSFERRECNALDHRQKPIKGGDGIILPFLVLDEWSILTISPATERESLARRLTKQLHGI
jgi:hypothetical protein